MHKKIISIIAGLLLMISTFVPFSKVLAQGLVEYAIILWAGVVAFNKNTESVELIYLPNPPSQAEPQNPNRTEGDVPIVFALQAGAGGGICSQIIQASVETIPGPNVMALAINGAKLVVNGEEVGEELDGCFGNAGRVRIVVGEPAPGSDPTTLPAIPPHLQFSTVTVVDKVGGGTKATSSWVGEGAHAFIEEVTP